MAFPNDFFEDEFDPNERHPITLKFRLKPNERVVTATVDLVDPQSRQVDLASKGLLVIKNFGQISGVRWGITGWLEMTSEDLRCCETLWLRYRGEIDATPALPLTRKFDRTWGLRIKQL